MREILKLKKYFFKYKWEFICGLLLLVIVDILNLLPARYTKIAVDSINYKCATPQLLFELGCYLILAILCVAIARFGWRYFVIATSHKIERDLRADFYRHVMRLHSSFFLKHRTGSIMALSSNDMVAIRFAMGQGILIFADIFIMSAVVLYAMININLKLTLFIFIPLPAISTAFLIFGPVIHRMFRNVQESFANMTTRTEENITGVRIVRAYVQEEGEKDKFDEANRDFRTKNMKLVLVHGFFHSLMYLLPSIPFGILVIAGGVMAIRGEITLGDFFAMTMYLELLIWPMIAIGWVYNLFQRASASIKRVWEVFDEEPEFDEGEAPEGLDAPIEIRDLTFAFPETETPVIRNLSLKIEKGEVAAIMGRTGSGKSTLISVLMRLYDPPRGTVFVGGHDVLDVPKQHLRRMFAVAPQEPFIFTDSISWNIAFGWSDAPHERIEEAAGAAQLSEEILKMPDSFETVVGERGVTLSGGQRQRTSIARAILRDAKVLVLDDSLSAVDSVTENGILKSFSETMESKTCIIISHRVNVAKLASKIFVLEKGTLSESGTEKELLENRGIYYDFYERQKLAEEFGEDVR